MTKSSQAPPMPNVLLDCVDDAILVIDEALGVRYANLAARSLAGPSAAFATNAAAAIHPDDLASTYDAVSRAVGTGQARHRVRLSLPTGERPFEVILTNHLTTDGVRGVVAAFRDVEREEQLRTHLEQERELAQRALTALTDPLTGFPTRRLALDRLQLELEAAIGNHTSVAVFFIDLDGFGYINDALGHTAGDAMLTSTASVLLETHPEIEHWGRLGGDEFLLFAPGLGPAESLDLGHRLEGAARRTIALGGRTFVSTVSIGATIARPEQVVNVQDIVRQADIAMHSGKRRSPGLVTLFDPEMQRDVVRSAELESQLRASLLGTGPGFALQPIVDLRAGTTYAVEALVRFRSPTLGPIPADQCVDIAERTGLVHQLDRHVLRKSCEAVRELVDPVDGTPVSLTVNTSSTTYLQSAGVADRVLGTLEESGLSPRRLVMEITESAAIEADPSLTAELTRLREAGVRVAIDDFGTGHSSLSQLERMPIDIVKIDRMFLNDIPESARRLRYLESITSLVDALELEVIVEGVERPEQIDPLRSLGVSLMQGYLFSQPAHPADIQYAIGDATDLIERIRVESGTPFQPVIDWTGGIGHDPLPD